MHLLIPHAQAGALSELYELGAPIEERRDEPEGVYILARLSPSTLGRLSRFVLADAERPTDKGQSGETEQSRQAH